MHSRQYGNYSKSYHENNFKYGRNIRSNNFILWMCEEKKNSDVKDLRTNNLISDWKEDISTSRTSRLIILINMKM